MKRRTFLKATACVACIPHMVFKARAIPRVGWADLRDKSGRTLASIDSLPLTDKTAAKAIQQLPLRLRRDALCWHMDRRAYLSLLMYRDSQVPIEFYMRGPVYCPPPRQLEGWTIEHVYDNDL